MTARRVMLVLASSTGGIGAHVASLAEGLAANGNTVDVAGPAATERQFRFTARGASFYALEIPPNLHPSDMRAVRSLRHLLATVKPEVVHAHGLRAGLAATLARPACPLVVTWHNAPLRGGLRGRMHTLVERIVGRAAAVTLCASSDLVVRAKAVGAPDVRFAPIAAPALRPPKRTRSAMRSALGVTDEQLVAVSVGRLHPQKGYDTLVQAAARWRDLHVRVFVAGEGPSYLDLAAQISELRAPVTLLGHRTDVADLLAAADVALVTSVWEARQLFTQEALSSGLPLIATAVGGIPELVGDAAVLIPPGDVEALDKAFQGLASDPALRADLAERGSARARELPDERSTVANVEKVYAEL
ncbi:glycosyltransferase family 4 protein [Allorhizocola rhizosphaerae]|uniref:glycosyltransferase family 4 protein n=1 Tax=Allorhizocola rhizosphaerae TaxID=1872709 RepID=UPI000E3BC05E|nr:glycosyltransferase family 4 protein [Allorhizocola rhizosphaerae]